MPKQKKDPNAPKRPLSAYLFYTQERRPELKEEKPDMKFGDYGKIMGKEWADMEDAEKKKFQDLAEKDKKRYEKELGEYKAN